MRMEGCPSCCTLPTHHREIECRIEEQGHESGPVQQLKPNSSRCTLPTHHREIECRIEEQGHESGHVQQHKKAIKQNANILNNLFKLTQTQSNFIVSSSLTLFMTLCRLTHPNLKLKLIFQIRMSLQDIFT